MGKEETVDAYIGADGCARDRVNHLARAKTPHPSNINRIARRMTRSGQNRVDPGHIRHRLDADHHGRRARKARTLTAQHRGRSKRECHIERDGYRCAHRSMTALFARKANDTDAAISSTMSVLPIPP